MTQTAAPGMTGMSHPAARAGAAPTYKYASRLDSRAVASGLLRPAPVLALALLSVLLSACILPLQFEDQVDAGTRDENYPPVVLSATPSLLEFQIVPINSPLPVTVEVEDKDGFDQTWLRIYRDYVKRPEGFIFEQIKGGSGEAKRTFQFDTATFCKEVVGGETVIIEIVLSDQGFLPVQEEPFLRAIPDTAGHSSAFWVVQCSAS